MMIELGFIPDNTVIEYTDHVKAIGIGNNVKLTIKNGSLEVSGNIGNDCKIVIEQPKNLTAEHLALAVLGNIGENTEVLANGGTIHIFGEVGQRSKILTSINSPFNSNIFVGNVHREASLKIAGYCPTQANGPGTYISAENIDEGAVLQAGDSGFSSIFVKHLRSNAKLMIPGGHVGMESAEPFANIQISINGNHLQDIDPCDPYAGAGTNRCFYFQQWDKVRNDALSDKLKRYSTEFLRHQLHARRQPPPPIATANSYTSPALARRRTHVPSSPLNVDPSLAQIFQFLGGLDDEDDFDIPPVRRRAVQTSTPIRRRTEPRSGNLILDEYLNTFDSHAEAFSAAFERLEITQEEAAAKGIEYCPITLSVPDIPVRLDDVIYDYNSLLKLPVKPDGKRENPINRAHFSLTELQAARHLKTKISEFIHEKEAALAVRP